MADPFSRAMQQAQRALSASAVMALLVSAGCSSGGWNLKERTGLWNEPGRPAEQVLSQHEPQGETAQPPGIPEQHPIVAREAAEQSSRRTKTAQQPEVRTVSAELSQPASLRGLAEQKVPESTPEPSQAAPSAKPKPKPPVQLADAAGHPDYPDQQPERKGFLRRWISQMRGDRAVYAEGVNDESPEPPPLTDIYRTQPAPRPEPLKFEQRRVEPEGPVVKVAPLVPQVSRPSDRQTGPVVKAAPLPFKLFDRANESQAETAYVDRLAANDRTSQPKRYSTTLRRDTHEDAFNETNALQAALDQAPLIQNEPEPETDAPPPDLRRLATSRRPEALKAANLRRLATSNDPQPEQSEPVRADEPAPGSRHSAIRPFRAPRIASAAPEDRQPVLDTRRLAEPAVDPEPPVNVAPDVEEQTASAAPAGFEIEGAEAVDQPAVQAAPLEPNLEAAYMVANWAEASYDEIYNYRAELVRRRLIDNQLSSREKVYFRCHRQRGALSAAWDTGARPDRQWLFVAGQNNNQVLVSEKSPLGRIRSLVDPSGASDGVRPMTEWGIGPTIARLRFYLEQHLAGRADVKYAGLERRDESDGLLHHVVASPNDGRQVVHFYFATHNLLPVLTEVIDSNGRVLEYEFFEKIEVNVAELDRPGVFASAQPTDSLMR